MNTLKMYLNNVNWKFHIAVMKEGITIFGKIAGTMIAVCALFATLITLFGWVVLPFIFLIIICVYFIWMIGNISITKKKWEEDRKEQ